MKKPKDHGFASEADLCAFFMVYARAVGWTPYPETAGWDILCVAPSGEQVGIQAKMALNVDVLNQTLETKWQAWGDGPDYRAILVPAGCAGKLELACTHLGITVVRCQNGEVSKRSPGWVRVKSAHGYSYETHAVDPQLPSLDTEKEPWWDKGWYERFPVQRHRLPEYVPDVVAGAPAPRTLSVWKIKAIKIAILLELNGSVSRADFKHIELDPRMWLTNGWLGYPADAAQKGVYIATAHTPAFRAQHPRNYEEIRADLEKWRPPAMGESK